MKQIATELLHTTIRRSDKENFIHRHLRRFLGQTVDLQDRSIRENQLNTFEMMNTSLFNSDMEYTKSIIERATQDTSLGELYEAYYSA